ncbi:CRISPR-associated endoribonuclease Cas6 [Clostridium sp. M14]|uniref:CRISPR-associated endoribonuclease Cas6 n=1 Tax=Clostridium sp. M14 TaxID=2716311 RepID=UPI0013EE5019|nr:CRISPR-associated endoribonuclease Cas6 [Clostridium sp. M14]MBZ9691137.1 CRISPR-associated endoribonuclease Cas6 [Clostridium sp. M14]
MRFKIEFDLKNQYLPLDYRPVIISLFKHSLTEYDEGRHFDTYYEVGREKQFTFSVGIPNSKFSKEIILVPNKKINILFSTGDIATGIVFFNALSMQKNKVYPLANDNTMIIKNIFIEKEAVITKEEIQIIFKSPLCVRDHVKESNKDIYYSYEKEGFKDVLIKTLRAQVENSNLFTSSILNGFSIRPIQCKKTVVRHHRQFIEVTVGKFILTGNIALLNYLYKNGLGSRKSGGFGMLDILS